MASPGPITVFAYLEKTVGYSGIGVFVSVAADLLTEIAVGMLLAVAVGAVVGVDVACAVAIDCGVAVNVSFDHSPRPGRMPLETHKIVGVTSTTT